MVKVSLSTIRILTNRINAFSTTTLTYQFLFPDVITFEQCLLIHQVAQLIKEGA